ncbi:hypothetical protein HZ996_05950 [Cryomorphaceae bacterium]|nr:hypothetical protein HZ996_05950 [Cryomorphaceae bacterium]
MNTAQRRGHFFRWVIGAPFLGIFIVLVLIQTPLLSFDQTALGHTLAGGEDIVVTLDVRNDHMLVLVDLAEAPSSSGTLAYGIVAPGDQLVLLGPVSTAGHYEFRADQQLKAFVLMDALKEVELYRTEF